MTHRTQPAPIPPSARRSLIKIAEGNASAHPGRYDLSSLHVLGTLGTVGEPIDPTAWEWHHKHIGGGRCPIVDTFWQTESGGHIITRPPARRSAPSWC